MQVQEVSNRFNLDRIVPFFQPIMDIEHNSVWRYECLARLIIPEQNAFTPNEFLYLIEHHGASHQLTETIFNRSAEYFRNQNMAWNINLGHSDTSNTKLVSWLLNHLQEYPNASRVGFELAAEQVLQNPALAEAFCQRCEQVKVKLLVDHFDQADWPKVAAFPSHISAIKLNTKQICQQIEKGQSELLASCLEHCKSNNIDVIAERVEQIEQFEHLQSLGIQLAQGFYLSKPAKRV